MAYPESNPLPTEDIHEDSEPANSIDPLLVYVRQIDPREMLTREQERRLAIRKDAGDEAAKKELIERNLRLVMAETRRYTKAGMPLLDLIQEGNLGLIRAVEKFDYRMGYKLSTYATWWIKQAITRGLADQARMVRLPAHVGENAKKVVRARREIAQRTGNEPTLAEIAEESGFSEKKVVDLLSLLEDPVSLDTLIGDDEETPLGDVVENRDSPSPEKEVLASDSRRLLSDALSSLPERERQIVLARFGLIDDESKTLEEISHGLDVTRERVRQIESTALTALRNYLTGRGVTQAGDLL